MKHYRCKHSVEAMQWTDTEECRSAFTKWFDAHGQDFDTRGATVLLASREEAYTGEWIVWMDGEFTVLDNEDFNATYEEVP